MSLDRFTKADLQVYKPAEGVAAGQNRGMRIAALLVLVLAVGCGPEVVAPVIDAGTLGAGGGGAGGGPGVGGGAGGGGIPACILDDCGARCGSVQDGCGGTMQCGACPLPAVVAVTFRYQYTGMAYQTECPGIVPTSTWAPPTCSKAVSMLLTKFQQLRLEYPSCDTTQTGSDSWTIDCTGQCTPYQTRCAVQGYPTPQDRTVWQCDKPKYASSSGCYWLP